MPGFVLALAVGLVLPGQAAGAVTIGSNLEADANSNIIFEGTTFAQRSLAPGHQAADGLTSPINGVVVRWRVKTVCLGPCPVPRFRVIRPGGDAFAATGAGTSDAPGAPPDGEVTSFEVNPGLPIKINDGIGLDGNAWFHSSPDVGRINVWQPPLADGEAPRQPTFIIADDELLLQAVIEPDKDGDGLGDESQDPDGGNPPPPKPPAKPACLIDAPVLGGNIRVLNNPCIARL